MSILFLEHILEDFWQELNNSLWISDFQNVVQVKLGLVALEPVLSPVLHLLLDLLRHTDLWPFALQSKWLGRWLLYPLVELIKLKCLLLRIRCNIGSIMRLSAVADYLRW